MISKHRVTVLFVVFMILVAGCSGYKNIPQGEHLVTSTDVYVNGKKALNPEFSSYIKQYPNSKTLMLFPMKLDLYYAAKEDPEKVFDQWKSKHKTTANVLAALFSQKGLQRIDSIYVGYNNTLRQVGEPPVLYDKELTARSEKNIEGWWFERGYFNTKVEAKTDFSGQKATVSYYVKTSKPYVIDSINTDIESQVLRELYEQSLDKTLIKSGEIYSRSNIEGEARRLTEYFKEQGVYNFLEDYIMFKVDTNNYHNKAQILLEINNQHRDTDSGLYSIPFHKWEVSHINVYTDYQYDKKDQDVTDTVLYKGLTIFNTDKVKYSPRTLNDAIFIRQGSTFSLSDYTDTKVALSGLRMFTNVRVNMNPDPEAVDSSIVADIYLSPVKKYFSNNSFEISNSSLLGIGATINLQLSKYNAFGGGEIWNNTLRATIGSYNSPEGSQGLFNAYEVSLTTGLTFPRFLLPFNTQGIVPKRFMPRTTTSFGFGIQKNVGLDRTYLNLALEYSWDQSRVIQHKLALLKFSYLSNTNKYNYFNIFTSTPRDEAIDTYLELNPEHIDPNPPNRGEYIYSLEQIIYKDETFKQSNPNDYRAIADDMYQYARYTSDFVIPSISYTFTFNNQRNDKSRKFQYLQAELAFSGNLLNALSKALNLPTKILPTGEQVHELFGVPFAQFAKFNVNYSQHINLNKDNVLAYRVYFGITLPYGNSVGQIPFSETYFGGGVNYERGWRAYELGPGSMSDKTLTYNIGNLKFTASLEYRFPVYRSLQGALFLDAGNIWYTSDKMISDPRGVFKFDRFYKELSLTSGVGLRYNFNFFIGRVDLGLKTIDPSRPEGKRWALFKDGINGAVQFSLAYPF